MYLVLKDFINNDVVRSSVFSVLLVKITTTLTLPCSSSNC